MSLAGNERDHNHVAVYVLCRIQLVPPAISLNTNRPEVMVKARRIIHDLPVSAHKALVSLTMNKTKNEQKNGARPQELVSGTQGHSQQEQSCEKPHPAGLNHLGHLPAARRRGRRGLCIGGEMSVW